MHERVARFRHRAWCFLADDSGPTIVEYAVALALIILGAVVAIASIGTSGAAIYQTLSESVLSLIECSVTADSMGQDECSCS